MDQTQYSQVGQEITILGRDHLKDINAKVDYNSNPPTSGAHFEYAEKWGCLTSPSRMLKWCITWNTAVFGFPTKTLMSKPKPSWKRLPKLTPKCYNDSVENDSKIALASWGRLVKLDAYDETKILEFIKANKNKSPEALAR